MLAEMTPGELMEWQALVRLEDQEREGKHPEPADIPAPPPEDPKAVAKRGQATQKQLQEYWKRRYQAPQQPNGQGGNKRRTP